MCVLRAATSERMSEHKQDVSMYIYLFMIRSHSISLVVFIVLGILEGYTVYIVEKAINFYQYSFNVP